jgi:RND family efflux transporter MFP subunit
MHSNIALILFCLAAVACKRDEEAAAPVVPKVVTCAPVQQATVRDAIEIRGTIAPLPERDAQVAPQVSGRVLRVFAREGDRVAQGEVVARIDDTTLVDAAHQAEAGLARARAEQKNAAIALTRVQRVFEHGIVARQEVDDATAKLASASAALAETEAAVRQAHRQIDRTTVHSPLRGVVLKVFRKAGELVDGTPATPIAEIADVSALELVADVPAQDLVRLARGQTATLKVSAMPDRSFQASVARVAPSVDRTTGVGTVRIAVALGSEPHPPVGAFGIARVESGQPHPATLVPRAALRSVVAGEGEVVVCGADHAAHVRKVTPGQTRDDLVEVRGELGAGDRVAVQPVLGLSEGDRLESSP